MPGDPWVYLPAFCAGGLACAVYFKQVFVDGREAQLGLVFVCMTLGYSAVIAVFLVGKTLIPELPVSLSPYRQTYVVVGGAGIFGYAVLGLRQHLIEWEPQTDQAQVEAREEQVEV